MHFGFPFQCDNYLPESLESADWKRPEEIHIDPWRWHCPPLGDSTPLERPVHPPAGAWPSWGWSCRACSSWRRVGKLPKRHIWRRSGERNPLVRGRWMHWTARGVAGSMTCCSWRSGGGGTASSTYTRNTTLIGNVAQTKRNLSYGATDWHSGGNATANAWRSVRDLTTPNYLPFVTICRLAYRRPLTETEIWRIYLATVNWQSTYVKPTGQCR